MTTVDVVYSRRFSLIKILPELGFDLGSTAGESSVLTARPQWCLLISVRGGDHSLLGFTSYEITEFIDELAVM